jgi:ankyrin repeat protein
VLIEAHPGSERITNVNGLLPLHCACFVGAAAEVQYLHKLYPDGTYRPTLDGYYPIHAAIKSVSCRVNPAVVVDIVQYLLDCHPNMMIQMYQGISVLLFACRERYDDISAIQVIKVIYDAHPEAIESNEIASNIHRYHQQVQRFINSELVYSRQARNHRLMTTPDDNGQLPLHTAVQNNVRLGSIKLLVRGNPSALRALDNNFALPLHVACQHHESASAVQYLLSLSEITLDAVDREGNTSLHYACRSAKYGTISLLLEKYDAVSISKRNAHKKLPIDLLFESSEVLDRESIGYTESIFRLLRAYPESIMNRNVK